MNDSSHLKQTLEYYRQQRQKHLDELKPIETMIRQLERDLDEPSTLGDYVPNPEIAMLPSRERVISTAIPVRPDEFFGMTQSDAAKAYLRKIGYAIAFGDLVDALRRGGAELGGKDPSKTLYVSLARNPKKEFVWPSKGHIGLKEFYDRKS